MKAEAVLLRWPIENHTHKPQDLNRQLITYHDRENKFKLLVNFNYSYQIQNALIQNHNRFNIPPKTII